MKIGVAISGGVDSSVAAFLLKEQGHEVFGVTMVMDSPDPRGGENFGASAEQLGLACADKNTVKKAEEIASFLQIPFYPIDVSEPFRKGVLVPLKQEYLSGRTPNPCVSCNCKVKFGAFLEGIAQAGIPFDKIATGHYARCVYCEETQNYELYKGKNSSKDQSYFLSMLTQKQLSKVIFPLGDFVDKKEVWKIAVEAGIPIGKKQESQDFLSGNYLKVIGEKERTGQIRLTDGSIVGEHKGFWRYTIGQRKGLGVSYSQPLYVVKIEPQTNIVYVGEEKELYEREFSVKDMNWINGDPIRDRKKVQAKIRYRSKEVSGTLSYGKAGEVTFLFEEGQKSITSGQIAVFYDNDRVLGGGVIV